MRVNEMHPLCCLSMHSFGGGGGDFPDHLSEQAMLSRSRSLPASCAAISGISNANAGMLHSGSASTSVAGILCKWTNYGKGWRSRWFLLRDGVLSYAKLRLPENLNIQTPKDDIRLIGQVSTNRFSRLDAGGGRGRPRKSVGVAHLKIFSFRESKSDDRGFYIFTATTTLHLRTDSKRDRAAWMQALHAARGLFPPRTINSSLPLVPSAFSVSTEMLKERLLEEGIDVTLVKDCEQIMLSEFSEIRGQLQVLCEERSNLIDAIRQLENVAPLTLPLLGETYKADYPEKGIRFFSEKVSHHPTLLACHCEGRGWKFWGDSNLHSKFWGRSIQLEPVGVLTVEFDDGEIFQWSKVHGYVENVIGKRVATLTGKWDECMYYVNGEAGGHSKGGFNLCSASLLWKSHRPPSNLTRCNLSSCAITLNELTEGLKERLPPTDSRLRPDQRHLENGEYDKANEEKQRLEKRQRIETARKWGEGEVVRKREREDGPLWYVGGYWEARETGKWEDCPDIFGELNEELVTNE